VDGLIHEHIEKWAKKRKRSWQADERALQKDVSNLLKIANAFGYTLILERSSERLTLEETSRNHEKFLSVTTSVAC